MRKTAVLQVLGTLLLVLAGVLAMPLGVAVYHDTGLGSGEAAAARGERTAFVVSIVLAAATGAALHYGGQRRAPASQLGVREGFAVVTLGWVVLSAFGALPLYLSGAGLGFTDCYFETMSGFTTTGATILRPTAALPNGIESLPVGLGLWRCMTQWLGGMGIVLLAVALLPLVGTGGYQLFRAEVPGPTKDRLTPRIRATAATLWKVYLLLTVLEIALLAATGMSAYEATCHTFTTLSTGGFSTRNASLGAFSPATQWVVMLFMFLAGVSFVTHYRFVFAGDLKAPFTSEELRWYVGVIVIGALLIFLAIHGRTFTDANGLPETYTSLGRTVRTALFNALTIVTTTGYGNADFACWPAASRLLIVILMFVGGCAASTAGGLKIARVMAIFKHGWCEIKRLTMPRAVLPVKIEGRTVDREVLGSILGLFLLWMAIVAFSAVALAFMLDLDDYRASDGGGEGSESDGRFLTALSAVASAIANVGPALAGAGPYRHYATIPAPGKWLLAALMLLGRLEVYGVLLLFSAGTWRK